ncbi:hypothetical protein EDI_199170 [Entamoeba dispar SAW760]|uniref:Uncharacterized protein n=1 Tax=Entamoeba dispar (strain ATCC PRA-260 / SAW760) TaxID=370354 RepID=B0EN03_ENTDS|nr:uncharacterized protein EDI_199170 [Entamoeba dispar SAW760]EDR24127.1 hypothetical protein EDI_199170 [Entamoeba dispar SAW760]|eukprot:EDR24127.1 hypothetical protein EDI_199170 [Entamoeba dispar SAW760]
MFFTLLIATCFAETIMIVEKMGLNQLPVEYKVVDTSICYVDDPKDNEYIKYSMISVSGNYLKSEYSDSSCTIKKKDDLVFDTVIPFNGTLPPYIAFTTKDYKSCPNTFNENAPIIKKYITSNCYLDDDDFDNSKRHGIKDGQIVTVKFKDSQCTKSPYIDDWDEKCGKCDDGEYTWCKNGAFSIASIIALMLFFLF